MQVETMAVKSRLKELIAERNLARIRAGQDELSIRGIAQGAGLSSSIISGLTANRTHRVDYNTLDKLCRFLECSPGDILVYVPEESEGA
jgi:putative transcriptional regulator